MTDDRELVNIIDTQFNISELKDLCFKLNIEYEDIPGQTKSGKARELYLYCKRRTQIKQLMDAIHLFRPETDLSEFGGPEPDLSKPDRPIGAEAAGNAGTNDAPAEPEPPKTVYDNFDITIRPSGTPNAYRIEAKSPSGEASAAGSQIFPFEDDEYKYLLNSLQDVQISETDFADDMGEILRKFLFPAPIQELFSTTLNVSRAKGRDGIRVRLNINQESRELYQVPWEYCKDDKSFLALNDDTPIVRYLPTNRAISSLNPPSAVKILLAWATPKDLKEINVQREVKAVKEALSSFQESGDVIIDELPDATPQTLRKAVRVNMPHIFHFIGHGKLLEDGEGAIALDDGQGKHQLLNGTRLLRLFQGDETKLMIFSACQSAAMGDKEEESNSSKGFMGLAPTLVWGGIPAVVAMQFDLPNKAAQPFMQVLYEFLALNKPLDSAITEARLGLDVEFMDNPYWGIPVLFMRSPDGNIWV